MSDRQEVISSMTVDGAPITLKLISHPVIDDILLTEAKIAAFEVENGPVDPTGERRVGRDVRDYLIRIGVER
jgi:hypothetical protein